MDPGFCETLCLWSNFAPRDLLERNISKGPDKGPFFKVISDRMDFTQSQSRTITGGQAAYAVPLIVAVTGHRDLLASEIPGIRGRVRGFLSDLAERYPERRISVLSPLAEGADRLVNSRQVLEVRLNRRCFARRNLHDNRTNLKPDKK